MPRSPLGFLACCLLLLCACSDEVRSPGSGDGGDGGDGGADGGSDGAGAAGGGGGGSPVGRCGDVAATAGSYFMALSLFLSPKTPIVFQQSVTADAAGLVMSLQPLAAADRKTPVGNAIVAAFPVEPDGAFDVEVPGASVPAEANPITNAAMVADLRFTGTACPASFCGQVTGQISQPIDVNVTSSTFRAERVMGTAYPEPPPIDCDGGLADPL